MTTKTIRRSQEYGFQSFTAETAEFAEKNLENSAFSRVLCGEKVLSHSVDKPSMYFENTMTKTQNRELIWKNFRYNHIRLSSI